MNQAIKRIRDRLAKQNLTMRQWALREGFTRQSVSITLKRWAGRGKVPHGGIARDIMARLERTLADDPDPTEPPPLMTRPISHPKSKLKTAERLALIRKYLDSGRADGGAKALAAEAGIHVSTVYRWVDEARKRGQDAVPVDLGVIGDRSVKFIRSSVPAADLAAVVGWMLEDPRRVARQGHQKLREMGHSLSYIQFTRILNRMTPSIKSLRSLATRGGIALRLEKCPKILRRWSQLPAGHTYVGDQHLLDYQCVLPETGEVVNLQLYLWMDAATTYWTGLVASYGPYTQYTVGLSLLDACRLHIPTALLNDNGKQERSNYVDALWRRIHGVVDFLDPTLFTGERHFTTPYLPTVKPIEAQMAVLTRYLNQEELPGYRKRDPDPFRNKERQGRLAREKKAGDLPTVDEVFAALVRVMERHNTTPARSEVDGDTYIPGERFWAGLAGRRLMLPEDDLKMLFYPRFERMIRNSAVQIKLGGKTLEFAHPALAAIPWQEHVQALINPQPPHDGSLALRLDAAGHWTP